MLGKKNGSGGKVETLLGKEAEFKGTIHASGLVRIDGRLEGEIITEGDLILGETAQVKAEVNARNLTLAGELRGNVELQGKLELNSSGRLYGDIKVSKLIIDEGGLFKGSSLMPGMEEDNEGSEAG